MSTIITNTTFPTLFAAATSLTKEQLAARANKSAFDEDDDTTDTNVLALGLLKTARFRHLNTTTTTTTPVTTKTRTAPPRELASLEKVLTRAAKDVLESSPKAAEREWAAFIRLATPVGELCPTIWRALDEMTERQLTTNANKSTPIKAVPGDPANAKERLMLTLARRCNAAATASAPSGTRMELNAAARRVLEASPKQQVAKEWEAYLCRCSLLHAEYVGDVAESGKGVRRALFAEPEPAPAPVQPAEARLCPTIWAALDTMTGVQLGNVANLLAPVPDMDSAGDADTDADCSTLKAKVLLTMAYRRVTDPTNCNCIYAKGQKVLNKAKDGTVQSEWRAYLAYSHLVYADYLATANTRAAVVPPAKTVQQKHGSSSSSSSRRRAQLIGAACAVALAYGSMMTMMQSSGQQDGGEVFTP